MTGAEIELLREIGKLPPQAIPAAVQTFTITSASDWPMFLSMIKFFGVVLVGAWGTIIGLLVYIYKGLMKRLGSQRAEDNKKCDSCKGAIWDHIGGPVWAAIEGCCPRMSDVEKKKLNAEIKKQAEGASA